MIDIFSFVIRSRGREEQKGKRREKKRNKTKCIYDFFSLLTFDQEEEMSTKVFYTFFSLYLHYLQQSDRRDQEVKLQYVVVKFL